jgi:hypothetical protein
LDSGNQKIFGQKILPQLAPLFAVREPYQIPLLLLQHLEFIYSRATPQQAKEGTFRLDVFAILSNLINFTF